MVLKLMTTLNFSSVIIANQIYYTILFIKYLLQKLNQPFGTGVLHLNFSTLCM
jgi:predicted membrane chloride channel (bestrophin family)